MKTKKKHLFIPVTVIILLLLSVAPGYAQDGSVISASVDRTSLTTDETLTLAVTINADIANPPNPSLPSLEGFTVVGSGSSSRISIVNGAVSTQLTYSYRLQPYAPGDLVIDPIGVTLNGQTFTTEPITVQVTQGTGAPPSAPPSSATAPISPEFRGQRYFVEAEVDNPTPFIGEQVNYTFRFYEAFDTFGQPQYEAPAFTGFWTENQTDQSQYQVQAGGQLYNVTELRTALFPSLMGPVTIEPARLIIPGGFFSSGGELQTQPVSVDVKPLPDGAPSSFNGAVGQFSLSNTLDTTQTRVNEPITWRVTLAGRGNLSALPDPVWPEMPEWRSFESQATTNTQYQNGQVVGERVYERLLVPQAEGEYTIPALEYTYFDPAAGAYQTLTTEAVPVSIAPGDPAAAETQNYAPVPGEHKESVEQLASDIRHVKPVPTRLRLGDRSVTESPFYWLAWSVPLLGIVGNLVWQRRQRFWQNNAGMARSSQARKKAKKALARVRSGKGDLYSAAGQVLTDYLADKLNQPVAGLTYQALATLLEEQGLRPGLIKRVSVCLTDAELGRFSPESNDPAHAANLLKEIDILIGDLEKEI
jgi:hypothetical protein